MASLTVVSYNTHEALADPRRSDEVLRFVEDLNPDVGTLHSGYWTRPDADSPLRQEESPVLERFIGHLGSLGYDVVCGDEGDTTDRPDKTGFVGLVRSELGTGSTLQAGTREGYFTTITDSETNRVVRIGGLHLTDTDEASRLVQVAGLPELDVLLTDANTMHRSARIARILRRLQPLTDHISAPGDRDHNETTGLDRIWSKAHILQSLVWMTDGRTMEALEAKGLHDADPSWRPTVQQFGIGVAQLDHILYNPASVEVTNFLVHKNIRVSDHWPLSASLKVKPIS